MWTEYFTAPRKRPIFHFLNRSFEARRDELLNGSYYSIKIILNQNKPIFVFVLLKPSSRQRLSKDYFSSKNDRAVFTETAS